MNRRFSHPKGERENAAVTHALDSALQSIPGVETILDMPCGSGRFADFLCEQGYRYCGTDVSMEMVSVLAKEQKKKGRALLLARCDGEALPFRDGAFDCVVCVRFLHHHIPHHVKVKILKEMRRVSRKWLIVQSQRLWHLGFPQVLKIIFRKMLGKRTRGYRFRKEAIEAGWRKEGPERRHKNRYFEIYEKV